MGTQKLVFAALVAACVFPSGTALAGTGQFYSQMIAISQAACNGIPSAPEKGTCQRNAHAFLANPAPCTSWRQEEYAFGMIQTVCTKNIDGPGWAAIRKDCFTAAQAKMQTLIGEPTYMYEAQKTCGIMHWHFTTESQEKCIEDQVARAKQDENAGAIQEQNDFKDALHSVDAANELERDGEYQEDRGCFAPVASDRSKVDPAHVAAGFVAIGCIFGQQACVETLNAVVRAGIPR